MLLTRYLGLQPYQLVFDNMKQFTACRDDETEDELWLVEHPAVYTQGQAGKPEHLLNPGSIPVIQSDRGGQITYHGPGQIVAYIMMDIKRRKLGIRSLVCQLEQILITLLEQYNIPAQIQCGAPGVYTEDKKIASIGLRVKNGCTYHGVALNVNMDLGPFNNINPCGYSALKMSQMADFIEDIDLQTVSKSLAEAFFKQFGKD